MKRVRDRWNGHLIIGLFTISFVFFPESDAVKATSLLFRTTTTTSTTTKPTEYEEGVETEAPVAAETTPSKNYTGIPQIDYIHDPNLPRELNGYNLSSYPFLETVPPPDEIDFKCDGLHDGFYASVPLKCQVYHQCLYGTRYDFLCANYTAFDQTTFICHFVSEVDCVNSPKFWSRNDALYKATTTSTVAPPTTTTTTTTPAPLKRRRPTRRRRPQYDYYDDDYYPTASDDEEYYEEDRGRRPYGDGRGDGRGGGRRRKRPRPVQRRPAYDEYEDDRYDRRQEGRKRFEDDDFKDRRPYDRPRKTTKKPSEDRDRPAERKPYDDDDRYFDRNRKNRPVDDKRSSSDSDRRPYEDDRRSNDRPRRPYRDDDRPSRDEFVKEEPKVKDERPFRDERPSRERPYRDERPSRDDERSNKNDRRPVKEEPVYEDDDRFYPEDKGTRKDESTTPSSDALVKPSGGSIFNKPRVPPKIARPVPSTEKEKYKYVTSSSAKAPSAKPTSDEEYYDDYELEDPKTTAKTSYLRSRTESVEKERYKPVVERAKTTAEPVTSKRTPINNFREKHRRPDLKDSRRPQFPDDDSYEDVEESRSRRLSPPRGRPETEERQSSRRRPAKVEEEYYYDEEEPIKAKDTSGRGNLKYDNDDGRAHKKTEKDSFTSTTTTYRPFLQRNKPSEAATTAVTPIRSESTSKDADKNDQKSFVRVVKRPFLPSRGGSPYLPRGLQPLGGKNFNKTSTTTTTSSTTPIPNVKTSTTTENSQADYSYDSDYDVKDDKSAYTSQEVVDKTPEHYSKDYEENQKYSLLRPDEDSKKTSNNKDTHDKYEKEPTYYSAPEKIKPSYDQNFRHDSKSAVLPQPNRYLNSNYGKNSDRIQNFKPSPQISDPYKPTNKPYISKIPENISIKQNLADSIETDYDVTLNDALNPTISNLPPVRNFPSPFIVPVDRDYTFARFRNGYNNEQRNGGNYNFQSRTPPNPNGKYESQRYVGQNYAKNDQIADSLGSASDLVNPHVVSVRTPQSFFIQPPRYSSSFSADETNAGLRPRHVTYRQVDLGDYA